MQPIPAPWDSGCQPRHETSYNAASGRSVTRLRHAVARALHSAQRRLYGRTLGPPREDEPERDDQHERDEAADHDHGPSVTALEWRAATPTD